MCTYCLFRVHIVCLGNAVYAAYNLMRFRLYFPIFVDSLAKQALKNVCQNEVIKVTRHNAFLTIRFVDSVRCSNQ